MSVRCNEYYSLTLGFIISKHKYPLSTLLTLTPGLKYYGFDLILLILFLSLKLINGLSMIKIEQFM